MNSSSPTDGTPRHENEVRLAGHARNCPELWYLSDGAAVARFEVRIAEHWPARGSNVGHVRLESHTVVVIGRLAEVALEYLGASMPVAVTGRLRTRRWQDKDGREMATTEIHADDLVIDGIPASAYF